MNDAETVAYEVRDGIATVKINRPEIRNALSPTAANRLYECWDRVDADKDVRVAILTSADCGTFCAGLDLREASRVKKEEGVDILTKMKDPFHARQRRVAKPIVAAMTGSLMAGGMMLAASLFSLLVPAVQTVAASDVPWALGITTAAALLAGVGAMQTLDRRLPHEHVEAVESSGMQPNVALVVAAVGAGLVVFGTPVLAFVGAALWGLGASLGFPVGMSAAADDEARAPLRISVVATIGYMAFIAGPPLLGFLGEHIGVLRALTVVGALALLALLVLPAVREPDRRAA